MKRVIDIVASRAVAAACFLLLCVFIAPQIVDAGESVKPAAKPSVGPPPTHADVAYGPHDRNVLDFWQAEGDGPRPLLVYIHGGGWTSGDKSSVGALSTVWPAKGVSVAAINYRLSTAAPLPAPVHDAARAVQFLRTKASEWNIDASHIALTGGSAGACTSMWLLCHDDLADPQADDPVLRMSTRVAAAAVSSGQTSIDPKQVEPWVGPNILQHRMIHLAVGERTIADALQNYEKHRETFAEFSPFNHVSADDPPLYMSYGDDVTVPSHNAGHGIHHPVLGVKMKERADAVGMECYLQLGLPTADAGRRYATAADFLEAKLLGK